MDDRSTDTPTTPESNLDRQDVVQDNTPATQYQDTQAPMQATETSYTAQQETQPVTTTATPQVDAAPQAHDNNKALYLAAYILNLISTIAAGIFIIPLAWMIPMTVISYGIYKGTRPNSTAFAVWTLLFVSFVSGILLLIADKGQKTTN